MKKDAKCYKIGIGLFCGRGDDTFNWRSTNVVAEDAMQAAKRVRLRKGEYVSEIELLNIVNQL